jgi:hypothetical protein
MGQCGPEEIQLMANNFKKGIDRMMWAQVAPGANAHAAGMGMATDLRNTVDRNPFLFQLASATVLNRFNIITKSWNLVVSPALSGTFGAGSGCVFAPSHALAGAIGVGSTPTSVVTTTAMTAVGVNMLANRGGSGEYGFKLRVIGKVSGKTEERWITGNTGGTTPTISLDSPLSFSPSSGDVYEVLGGRVFMLNAGTLAAGSWKSFEVASNTLATKTQTNLPATVGTAFSAVALDELYVPYDRKPGEGFLVGAGTYNGGGLLCLVASGIAASSLTGQNAGGDAGVLANEYRNFQIRIVEDTATPTAVGQRRIIASHTGGPSPVYTLGTTWTVNPSATAKFVVELPNLIVLWTSASTTTYAYNYGTATVSNGTNTIGADAWSSTYFSARGGAMAAGCTSFASFGIEPDDAKNARSSFIHSFRGGGVTTLDTLDIAGAITGLWFNAIVYDGGVTVGTGSCGKYAPADQEGRFGYMNIYTSSALSQMFRFDVKNRVLSPYCPTDWVQSGTAAAGDRIGTYAIIDGQDKYSCVFLMAHLTSISQELIIEV